MVEANSGAVDNNRGKDFQVRLLGALTQEQILERQAAALAEFEQMRLEVRAPHLQNAIFNKGAPQGCCRLIQSRRESS